MRETTPMRKIQIRAGHYYPIYNRGINGEPLFFRDENWAFFIQRVRKYFVADFTVSCQITIIFWPE